MTVEGEINKRTNNLLKGLLMRKIVLLIVTLVVIILGCAAGFYFQLALNGGMSSLITGLGIVVCIVLTVVSKLLAKSDNYIRTMIIGAAGSYDISESKSLADAMSNMGKAYPTLDNANNFKAAVSSNKMLLKSMCKDCAAFEEYLDKGPITLISKIFAPFAFSSFNYFAIIDAMLNAGGNNERENIIASTKWFPIYKRYSKAPIIWLLLLIVPVIAWFIGKNIVISLLTASYDVNAGIQNLVTIGTLCMLIQGWKIKGREKQLKLMVCDFVNAEKQVIPEAQFNLAKAFADNDAYYKQQCIKQGFIRDPQQG